jgi:hypothetical protein
MSTCRRSNDLLKQPTLMRIRHAALENAINSANSWISRHALVGTNVGSDSANEIYERIVQQLVSTSVSKPKYSDKKQKI